MPSTRQLAAIMFTDIVGYTTLMGADERKAMELVRRNKEVQKPLVEKYKGTWLKEMGDGAMSSFTTASDAIYCAIEIQRALFNDKELNLRIGIHLGEIILEEGDIYGDGVNIASRLESIAEPGGIYISDSVQKAIRANTDIQSVLLGELELKNVDYPVKTYALRGEFLPRPEKTEEKHLSGRWIAELQRRNVPRAGLAYLAVAFIVYSLLPYFSLNPIITKMVYGVLVLGIPISLYLAWNYERSPEGFVRVGSRKAWANPFTDTQKKPFTGNLVIVSLLLIIIVLVGFPGLIDKNENLINTSEIVLPKSIAILPFRNLGSDPEQAYFGEGVAEMIRTKLSKVKELSVTSMRSVLKYADSDKSVPEIGAELDVSYILEGSIIREGNTVRLFAQLIESQNDHHVWSETYDRDLSEILKIQSEIAQEISQALEFELIRTEYTTSDNPNLEVLDLILAGNHNLNQLARTGRKRFIQIANDQFQKALALQPGNSEALLGLGWTYYQKSYFGEGVEWLDSAKKQAQEIMSGNVERSGAYHLLGRAEIDQGKYEQAKVNLVKCLEEDPNNGNAMFWLSWIYNRERNFEKGIPLRIRSFKLDPSNPENTTLYDEIASLYVEAGMNLEAIEMFEKHKKLFPDDASSYQNLLWIYWSQGQTNLASKELEEYYRVNNEVSLDAIYASDNLNMLDGIAFNHWLVGDYETSEKFYLKMKQMIYQGFEEQSRHHTFRHRLAYIYWQKGDTSASKELFREHIQLLEKLAAEGNDYRGLEFDLAGAYTFIGDKEKAYQWLDKMPYWNVTSILIMNDPLFNEIREEEHFKDIMKRLNEETSKIRNVLERLQMEDEMSWMLSR